MEHAYYRKMSIYFKKTFAQRKRLLITIFHQISEVLWFISDDKSFLIQTSNNFSC